jgi:alanine racemase
VNEICPEITVDLLAIKENYRTICRLLGDGRSAVSAVVKNDAYGLGAQRVSRTLYEAGCRDFWVAYAREAVDIRRVLPFDANIYYLQGFCSTDVELLEVYRIVPVINSLAEFNAIKSKGIGFILHVDTGLTRLGLRQEDLDMILPDLSRENVLYVISHLACGDGGRQDIQQKRSFDETLTKVRSVTDAKGSLVASNIVNLGRDFLYDLVRVGAFLYGIRNGNLEPRTVLCMKTKVLQTYSIPSGTNVGYGATHVTDRETEVAIISVGYADGIKRHLSSNGCVLFYDSTSGPYKARILGRISMDLTACDITDVPNGVVVEGADAILLDDAYTINEMSEDAQTISYEILTSINFKSKRFKLTYTE